MSNLKYYKRGWVITIDNVVITHTLSDKKAYTINRFCGGLSWAGAQADGARAVKVKITFEEVK